MASPIVVALLAVVPFCVVAVEDNNVVYADPMQMSLNVPKQEAASHGDLLSIHRILDKQTESLVKIMTKVEQNEELTKTIIKQLEDIKRVEAEVHGKIEASNNRRNIDDKEEIPIVKFGKDIVRYGNLLKTVVMSDFTKDDSSADLYKESSEDDKSMRLSDDDLEATERYFDRKYTNGNEQSFANGNSVWCFIATKCNRTVTRICGFDDIIGLAKFNDMCHMLQTNCYWNFNFSVASC